MPAGERGASASRKCCTSPKSKVSSTRSPAAGRGVRPHRSCLRTCRSEPFWPVSSTTWTTWTTWAQDVFLVGTGRAPDVPPRRGLRRVALGDRPTQVAELLPIANPPVASTLPIPWRRSVGCSPADIERAAALDRADDIERLLGALPDSPSGSRRGGPGGACWQQAGRAGGRDVDVPSGRCTTSTTGPTSCSATACRRAYLMEPDLCDLLAVFLNDEDLGEGRREGPVGTPPHRPRLPTGSVRRTSDDWDASGGTVGRASVAGSGRCDGHGGGGCPRRRPRRRARRADHDRADLARAVDGSWVGSWPSQLCLFVTLLLWVCWHCGPAAARASPP